jgi:hypothetical protein
MSPSIYSKNKIEKTEKKKKERKEKKAEEPAVMAERRNLFIVFPLAAT